MPATTADPIIQRFLSLKLKDQRAYLCGLREVDPAAALSIIESVWDVSEANARRHYLDTIGIRLSMADEPFLEAALDNRSKRVTAMAVYLLSLLPESRLAQRATRVALIHVDYMIHKRPNTPDQLLVTLPTTYDPAWKRDAIAEKAAFPVINYPFFWLTQMISRVPPHTWTRRWGKIPPQIIRAAFSNETYGEGLVTAFINATVRHSDPDWAESLLIYNLESLTAHTPQHLITLVPQNRRERLFENALTAHPIAHPVQGLPPYFFWWLKKPWSKHLSAFILDRLAHYANPATPEDATITSAIPLIAEGLHRSLYPRARSKLGPPNLINPYLQQPITSLLQTLKPGTNN